MRTLHLAVTTGAAVLLAVLVLAVAAGLWHRRQDGRLRPPRAAAPDPTSPTGALTPADLPVPLGQRATLVQFSSAFCAPCRTARVVLAEVARTTPGVVHVEIDAEQRLDLVRRVGVLRTPTVLVLDAHGVEVRRASGAPRKVDVLAALADVG